MILAVTFAALAILMFCLIEFRWYLAFLPSKKLVVLMYHSIGIKAENSMTVSVENLEKQLKYLKENGYKTCFLRDLANNFTPKTVILTFDDGYENNKNFLLPLLEKYDLKATIFLPTSLLENDSDKMNFETIRNLNRNHIELGLHSHKHVNYSELTTSEIKSDLIENQEKLQEQNIEYTPALAYPFGKFPKENSIQLSKILKELGIIYGLRIGNKLNSFPIKNPYEICRIEILGQDSLLNFKRKLMWGRIAY